jgi:hypothetical protein
VLKVKANFKECKVPITVWGEHVSTSTHFQIELLYHANGLVQNGYGLSETAPAPSMEVGSGSVTMGFANTGGCKVIWPAQTIPASAEKKPLEVYPTAVFSNEEVAATNLKLFPSGFQRKLLITNEFKGIVFSVEEKGLCTEFEKTEGSNGHYNGKLLLEVPSGNLGFE